MRAVQVARFGGPEVLEPVEVPEPNAGAGEVVVEVEAADVLFLDTQLRAGWGEGMFPLQPPYVPGDGVAGTVVAVGDGVEAGWLGRRVAGQTGRPLEGDQGPAPTGGYAERAVVPVEKLTALPAGLDARLAVGLIHDGATAYSLFARAAIKPGERVLITAAAGGLGILLTQLATSAGARVIGAARGAAKLDRVRELGADLVVDYAEPDWRDRVLAATNGVGVDVVFEAVGGALGGQAFGATRDGGRLFAYGAASGDFADIDTDEAQRRGVQVLGIWEMATDEDGENRYAERAFADAADGTVRPVVGQTFPLERAADAHAAMADRSAIGRTLLVP